MANIKVVRRCLNGNSFLFNGDRIMFLLMRTGGTLAVTVLPFEQWHMQDLTAGVPPLAEGDCQRFSLT